MLWRIWEQLCSLFRKKEQDIYAPSERNVYKYFNGSETVTVDPLVLYRAIMSNWPELKADFAAASMTIPNKWTGDSQVRLVEKLRSLFHIQPLYNGIYVAYPDGKGTLTDMEVMDLLDSFLIWSERLKKNTKPPPTSPMVTLPTTKPSSGGGSVSSNTSDSGSITTEQKTEESKSSPLVQPLPSDSLIPEPDTLKT